MTATCNMIKTILNNENIKVVSEYLFHPKRRFRFDFAIVEKKIAIEIEGGSWSGGRHVRGAGYRRDCEKYNEACLLGWRVLRYTSDMLRDADVVGDVKKLMEVI